MGYLIAVAFQLTIVAYTLYFISTFLSFAIGSYLFSLTVMKEIREMIESYNDYLKMKPSQADMMKELSEATRFAHCKQLVKICILD